MPHANRAAAPLRAVRSTLAASLILASVVAGATVPSRPAHAQGAGKVSMQDIHFGPVTLEPISPNLEIANESVEVALLLPAVQKVREAAARISITGDGWSYALPVLGKSAPSIVKLKLQIERSTGASPFILHVRKPSGEVEQVPVSGNDFAVQISGLVQSNRRYVDPESATVKHNALNNVLLGDGSVRGILIGLLLPAVQKVR